MRKMLAIVLLLAGCATQSPRGADTSKTFTGEVWTWDAQQNIVTLRQGTETIRVRVTPEQIRQLQLHQVTTVRGELAGPAEIERFIRQPRPTVPVPRGAVEEAELTGKVVSVDPRGTVAIDSPRGQLQVWVASAESSRFQAGHDVRVRVAVQPVDLVPAERAPTTPPPTPAVSSEPGDYAVVTGAIIRVDPAGGMTVESPRGPVSVWVPGGAGYRVGDSVQVRTSVHPGR